MDDLLIYIIIIAGKTLLAKAVANQTSATFLRVCGSELIQKYLVSILFVLYIQLNLYNIVRYLGTHKYCP